MKTIEVDINEDSLNRLVCDEVGLHMQILESFRRGEDKDPKRLAREIAAFKLVRDYFDDGADSGD